MECGSGSTPQKLKARNLTTEDVLGAIREQNIQVAAGQVGQYPSPGNQAFQYNITTMGRLSEPEQFGDIIVKTAEEGRAGMRLTRVKDVSRVELGAQVYDQWCEVSGKPAAGVAIFQLPGANALTVARRVKDALETLKPTFPRGLEYSIAFDTTIFVNESIREVYKTLLEAGLLVLVVILLFLQDWRAVLIPATTVPVTIIGAFAAMAALGFSINMLTMFGLILAIGIVVDDAIVIVENAAAPHRPRRPGPEDPPRSGPCRRCSGPVIGITLVLLAVFVPAVVPGRDHRPALPPVRAHDRRHRADQRPQCRDAQAGPVRGVPEAQPRAAERVLSERSTPSTIAAKGSIRRSSAARCGTASAMMVLFVALAALTGWWFTRLPTGFFPEEDQGYAIVGVQLPDAASQVRTRAVVSKVDEILKNTPGVERLVHDRRQLGPRRGGRVQRRGSYYLTFTPWEERTGDPG